MLRPQYCRLEVKNSKVITKEGFLNDSGKMVESEFKELPIDWQNQIIQDKQYGKAVPKNGKYFTFRFYDEDIEVPKKVGEFLAGLAYTEWEYECNFDVRPAEDIPDDMVDFRIYFATPQTDDRLTGMTLAVHYYPIVTASAYRGVCIINKNYYYTIHGKPISLGIIDPAHYKPDETKRGSTHDLRRILRHEFGHGFGLPHTGESGHTMSGSYTHMSEFLTDFDIARLVYKYGAKKWKSLSVKLKIRKWFRDHKSKNLPDELKPLVNWE